MPGRTRLFPALVMALLGLAASGEAQDERTAAGILDAYRAALGPRKTIRALASESTVTDGSRSSTARSFWGSDGSWMREFAPTESGRRVDYFRREGAFIYSGRARAGFQPGPRGSRAWYYAMSALAQPFALFEYVGNDKAAAGLQVGQAHGYDILATQPDAQGVRTLYAIDRKTGLLAQVRFEREENRPFATLQFERHGAVQGVMLPRRVIVDLRLQDEDAAERTWVERRVTWREDVARWQANPESMPDLAPPEPADDHLPGFERSSYPTVPDPVDLVVSDLDRDGKRDVAVCGAGGVAVHFGGAFAAPLRLPLGEGSHRGCRVTDFDLDGVPDLLVMSWTKPSDRLFLVSFPGGRTPRVRELYVAPNQGQALVVDDFDLDGLPDFVASGKGSCDVAWKFGNGVGGVRVTGTTWKLLEEGRNPLPAFGLATGDLNGDGIRDVVAAEPSRPRVAIFFGRANLSFDPRLALTEKNTKGEHARGLVRPVDVALADLDGDGKDDLVIAEEHPVHDLSEDVSVLLNTGTGFRPAGAFAAGERLMSIRVADLDGDGKPDLFGPSFLTDQLAFLKGKGDGTFEAPRFAGVARGPVRAETGDVDGDGRPDVVVASLVDSKITILRNTRGEPRAEERRPGTRVVDVFHEGEAKVTGLTEEYAFAGEYRIPAFIRDPSGLAFLHEDQNVTGLVFVSDKANALFRATVDHRGRRLFVAPAIALRGAPEERLDLEGVAFDRGSGTLFLACESDSSIRRATLFGGFLGRAESGVPVGDNDGVEGLALRRKRDGTPLLYVLRERLGTTGAQPPVHVFDLFEDPFRLQPRGEPIHLPAPLIDQTGAVADGERLFVIGRFVRAILEVPFEGDGFGKTAKTASLRPILEDLLGYPGPPAFGIVEGIARAERSGDLFLLVDNNGEEIGGAKNRGREGRLIHLRCITPRKAPPAVDRVELRLAYVPFAGLKDAPKTERTKQEALATAQRCAAQARQGADWDALQRECHDARGAVPAAITVVRPPRQKQAGELDHRNLPAALFRLAFELAPGDVEICEYDEKECPWGYYVVRRVE